MSLPVLHSFAGYSIYQLSHKKGGANKWKKALYFVFIALLADLDFIPGLFLNEGLKFHRGLSHSILGAFIVGFVLACAIEHFRKGYFSKIFLGTTAAYMTHVLLDFGGGGGVPLLWPFSSHLFGCPIFCFELNSLGMSLREVSGFSDFWKYLSGPVFGERAFAELTAAVILCTSSIAFCELRKGLAVQSPAWSVRLAPWAVFFIVLFAF